MIMMAMLYCMAVTTALAQRKLSQLPVAPISDSVRLIGVETLSGVSTDNRYSLHDLSLYLGSISSQNISNTGLHWNGDYTQHVHKYSLLFDKVNSWQVIDTNNNLVFSLNNVPAGGMLFSNADLNMAGMQTVEGLSGIFLNYSTGVAHGHMHTGSAIISLHQDPTANSVRATAGGGGNMWLLDSAKNNFSVRHFAGNSSLPAIAVGGGAGTGAIVTLSPFANDVSGYISVTAGTSPIPLAAVFTVTFNTGFQHAPECIILTPANAVTQQLAATKQVYIDQATTTTATFTATSGTVALTAGAAYKWYYLVIE